MKRTYQESVLNSVELGSVEELMKQILRASVPRLKFYTWQDCRRLLEKRLVSRKFSQWVDEVFRSVRYLSKELTKEWTFPELVELEGLEKFRIERNRDGFMFIPQATNLRELFVRGQEIHDRHIQSLTSLRKLYLSGKSSVTNYSLQCLSNLTKLRHTQNSKITLDGILACTKLESLKLDGFAGEIEGISRLTRLKSLSVKYTSHVKESEYRQWTQLTKLNMKLGPSLTDRVVFQCLTNLTSLSCSYCNLIEFCDTLRRNLVKLNVTSIRNTYLLSEFVNLKFLKVKNCFLFIASHFEKLSNLTTLSLGSVEVHPDSVRLPNFPQLKNLTHLYCNGCDFDQYDIRHLTSLTKLKTKNVRRIENFVIGNMSKMKNLKKVCMSLPDNLDFTLATKFPLVTFHLYYSRKPSKEEKNKIIRNGFILKDFYSH